MLDVKPFRQRSEFCGPACLKMVLEYYGVRKSEKELARLANYTKSKGASAENLLKAAKKLGFKGAIKDFAEIKDVREYVLRKKTPVIVPWFSVYEDHYSVVVDIGKDSIYLQDPELGHLRAMKVDRFKILWFDLQLGNKPLRSRDQVIIRRLIAICPK